MPGIAHNMDLRTLRFCEATARLGSITRAAEELHVAQPAISVAIKKLEEELGVLLFARSRNRRVALTAEGAILLRRAQRVFDELDSAQRELADAAGLRAGEVTLGLPPMYGLECFPPLMAAFHAAHPGIVVSAIEGSAGDIKARLDTGEIDLAILESRRVQKGWSHVPLGHAEVVLCVRSDHPLAGRTGVAGADLDELAVVLLDETFLQRNVLDQLSRKAGVKPRPVMQSNYVPLVQRAVLDGLGAAMLLRSMAESDPRLVALPFDPPEMFHFSLCWLDGRYLSKANQAFVDFVSRQRA
jgi:DNA-binding transcriptional LysR family regulator